MIVIFRWMPMMTTAMIMMKKMNKHNLVKIIIKFNYNITKIHKYNQITITMEIK